MSKSQLTKYLNRYFEKNKIGVRYSFKGEITPNWHRNIIINGIIVDIDFYKNFIGEDKVEIASIKKYWKISHRPTALNFLLGVITNLKYV